MTNPAQYPGAPAPAPRTGAGFSLSLADLLVGAGSLLVFFFSFAPLWSSPSYDFGFGATGGGPINSWGDFAPLSVWPVLAALLAVGVAVIAQWWPKDKEYVGFKRSHVAVGLTLFTWVTLLGFWFTTPNGLSFGWGAVIMVIGSTAATAGAILGHLGMLQNSILPMASRPAAVGYQPPAGYQASPGYQPPQGYQPPGQQYAPPPGQTMPAGPYTPPAGQQPPSSDTIV